jgi:hypothetical protein
MTSCVRMSVKEVVQHFEALDDPRSPVNRLHPLESVLVCRCGKREKSFRRGNRGGVWRSIFKQQQAIGRPRRAFADSSTAARPPG